MTYVYISLGCDCSPATILKNLNLRNCALPFDWIDTSNGDIIRCFDENFKNFFNNLTIFKKKKNC